MSHHAAYFLRFLVLFTAVLGGLHWYVWRRLVSDTQPPRRLRRLAGAGYLAVGVIFIVGGMGGRFLAVAPSWMRWVANVWLGLLGLLVFALLVGDLLRAGVGLRRRVGHGARAPSPERRLFLARALAGSAAAAAAALGGFGMYEALRRVRTKRVDITLAKLPPSADGYRIAQISDVHVGPLLGKDFVEEVVANLRAIEPDLIVITGDLVDGSIADLDPLLRPLAGLRARDGVYFVTGNHEYYSGAEAWCRHLPALGIQPLRNERVRLGAFELAGVYDWGAQDFDDGHIPDVPKACAGRDPNLPLVLLAHRPQHAKLAMANGVDLQLSGHTHGGQMFPMTLLVRLSTPFTAGLYRENGFQIYVSPGTGYWGPPMRLGTEAEVTHITLRRGA